ncbi:MAG: hypothetical protein ACTSPB_21435 [Candidatus Thorarchaeota archaeon]
MTATDDNIIHYDLEAGILICQNVDTVVDMMVKHDAYPIILRRSRMGTRFTTVAKMPKHPWQHKIIMNAFEKIGWPVKVTANGKYYSLKNKKDRFRFKLKYGNN